MKKGLLILTLAMLSIPFQQTARAEDKTKEVMIGIADAFIPGGFNSGSDAYVVANGIFPNGCYRWARASVTNVTDLTHEVKSFASVQQGLCLMVLVPFNKEIRLGKLARGNHSIRFLNGDGTYLEKQMTIE